MLSNFSPYSPQGLLPQFSGLQAAGFPQAIPGLLGQPGAYNGSAQSGHESGQAGLGQPFPFGGQTNPLLQNPFAQNPFASSPFAANPYQHSPWLQSPLALNPFQSSPFPSSIAGQPGANSPLQQIVPVLGQLAQQIAVQGAVAQQIGIAVHQLAHQLALQSLQGHPGGGFGAGQGFAGAFGPNAFSHTPQGGYGGFNPQAPAWGANRPQTIQ